MISPPSSWPTSGISLVLCFTSHMAVRGYCPFGQPWLCPESMLAISSRCSLIYLSSYGGRRPSSSKDFLSTFLPFWVTVISPIFLWNRSLKNLLTSLVVYAKPFMNLRIFFIFYFLVIEIHRIAWFEYLVFFI